MNEPKDASAPGSSKPSGRPFTFVAPQPDAKSDSGRQFVAPEPDKKPMESITIGETPLPKEYQAVLNQLRPDIPGPWSESAKEAAYYIYSFEQGRPLYRGNHSLEDAKDRFARQIAHSDFIREPRYGILSNKPQWQNSLPDWIIKRYQPLRIPTDQEEKALDDFLKNELLPKGKARSGRWGEYIDFETDAPKIQDPLVEAFSRGKAYLASGPGQALSNLDSLRQAFEILRQNKLHPDSLKKYEYAQLVLYFPSVVKGDGAGIAAAFAQLGLPIRGPAQDVNFIEVSTDGNYKIVESQSNDNALMSYSDNFRSVSWYNESFDPTDFLRKYLHLVFQYGKDPKNPYYTGLMRVFCAPGDFVWKHPGLTSKIQVASLTLGIPYFFTRAGESLDPFKPTNPSSV